MGKGGRLNVDMMIGLRDENANEIRDGLVRLMNMEIPKITIYAQRRKRDTEEQNEFEEYAHDLVRSFDDLDDNYVLIADEKAFQENSYLIQKQFKRQFKKLYKTHAHFNSNMGFGRWAQSCITPLKFAYEERGDGYRIVYDPAMQYYNDGCYRHYKEIFTRADYLREEGNDPAIIDI